MFGNTASICIRRKSVSSVKLICACSWRPDSLWAKRVQQRHGRLIFGLVREWDLSTFPYQSKVRGGWRWETRTEMCSWLQYSTTDTCTHRIKKKNTLWCVCGREFPAPRTFLTYVFSPSLNFVIIFQNCYPSWLLGSVWCFQGRWPRLRAQFTAQCLPAGDVPPEFVVAQTNSWWLSRGNFQAATWDVCTLPGVHHCTLSKWLAWRSHGWQIISLVLIIWWIRLPVPNIYIAWCYCWNILSKSSAT